MNITDLHIGYDPYYERVLFTVGDKTFSYSPKIEGWISRHDYLPDIYFNTKREFFSTKDNGIYQHNHGNRGEYYDVIFDTIYEYVDNREPHLSKIATGLWMDTSVYDTNNTLELHKTFDAFRIYNNYQDTQQQDITYFADEPDNPYIGNARKTKNRWFINQFRDQNNIPQGVTDSLKWAYERRMQDHYQQVKLIKHNHKIVDEEREPTNEKILLFRTNLIFKESIR